MKINNGFITNSSSTSFIISTKEKSFTKEAFLKAIGVTEDSLLYKYYFNFYSTVKDAAWPVPKEVNIIDYLQEHTNLNDEKDLQEIKNRYNNGEDVYIGKLDDSGETLLETYYSRESFVIVGDDFYFNARNSIY